MVPDHSDPSEIIIYSLFQKDRDTPKGLHLKRGPKIQISIN